MRFLPKNYYVRILVSLSREGALNLLRDFDGVVEWILACDYVLPEHVEILSKHEVLRTCEGVGKILLRKPYEVISMANPVQALMNDITSGMSTQTDELLPLTSNVSDKNGENSAQLPPEMFVPNQQRWLELRARNRNRICSKCTCTDTGINEIH